MTKINRALLRKRIAAKVLSEMRVNKKNGFRQYKSVDPLTKARLQAVAKGVQAYQEYKSRLEDIFENTLEGILRDVKSKPDGENLSDNIKNAYKEEVQPLLDKMLFEDAYWHFEAIVDINLNIGY
mgnify:CR=1 FL=1